MSRTLTRPAARIVVPPTVVLLVVLAVVPSRAELALHVWLLVVLALVGVACVRALRRAYPAPGPIFATGRAGAAEPRRFESLARIEREVSAAATSAYDVHFRLRPTLRELAAGLLSARRGIGLDTQPHRACEVLGAETWELVRADRAAPAEPRAPGLDREALERVLSSLEHV